MKKSSLLLSLLLIFFISNPVYSQFGVSRETKNPFITKMFYFPSDLPGGVRSVFLIQVHLDRLLFTKADRKFLAKYGFELVVKDGSDSIKYQKDWEETLSFDTFKETMDDDLRYFYSEVIDLEPGLYSYDLKITEMETRKTFNDRGSKIFPPLWVDKVGISDIIITGRPEEDYIFDKRLDEENEISIDFTTGFFLHYQFFSSDLQPFRWAYKLFDISHNAVPILGDSSILQPTNNIIDLNIPVNGNIIPSGQYLFQSIIRHQDGTMKNGFLRFTVAWNDKPITSFNIEESIDQMRYMLNDEDIARVNEMAPDEKQLFFEEYWANIDPTPGTAYNELFDEYYKRIEYSNQNFSAPDAPGWETDRGRIYITFGVPDIRSQKTLLTLDGPSETWTYFNLRRKYIFVDTEENGLYQLKTVEDIIR
ncbi:MAG: GWxTD domain-containing protein [bacterium]|nr:GWxTD domain-containing protein [bacterium]